MAPLPEAPSHITMCPHLTFWILKERNQFFFNSLIGYFDGLQVKVPVICGESVPKRLRSQSFGSRQTWVLVLALPLTSSVSGFLFLSYKMGIKITPTMRVCESFIKCKVPFKFCLKPKTLLEKRAEYMGHFLFVII